MFEEIVQQLFYETTETQNQLVSYNKQRPKYSYSKRKYLDCEVSTLYKVKYHHMKSGKAHETSCTLKHAKTALLTHFMHKHRLCLLNQTDIKIINQFKSGSVNFMLFQRFFGTIQQEQSKIDSLESDHIRQISLEYFNDATDFLSCIIKSKMNLSTKLMLLKYLEELRKGAIMPQNFNKLK